MSKERPSRKIFHPREESEFTKDLAAENKPVMSDSGNPGNLGDNPPSQSQGEETSDDSPANQTSSAETGSDSSANQTSEGK